jgi:transcription factor SFP1
MMDIEMDDPAMPFMANQAGMANNLAAVPGPTPWATAFRNPLSTGTGLQGVPPSLLSFTPPPTGTRPATGLTSEQIQAKALRKAQRKAEKAAAREEASASDNEGEKRFACPIEGCGKVYKQANGLKYHLTRSINSGHGNVAAMGGLVGFMGDKTGDGGED